MQALSPQNENGTFHHGSTILSYRFYLKQFEQQALEKYKIAKVVTLETTGNNKKPRALQLTTQTDNPETVRLFNLLYDLNRAKNELFDPLEIFHEEDQDLTYEYI